MFRPFLALPRELRAEIWEYVFLHTSVVAFAPTRSLSGNSSAISQTCKEARYIYEKSYRKVMLLGPENAASPIWLSLPQTVFYLGHHQDVNGAVDNLLSSKPCSDRIQHIAVGWSTYRELITLCKRLSLFYQLQSFTILIQTDWQALNSKRIFTDKNTSSVCACVETLVHHAHPGAQERTTTAFDTHYLESIVKSFLAQEFRLLSRRPPQVNLIVGNFLLGANQ